jgi:hypothetical protein
MVNKKYELLDKSLDAITKDVFNLLVCSGDYGMGKSHRIKKYVDDKKIDYAYIQSYATPLKFYQLLYENRDKELIIFDDVNSIDNSIIVGLLKSACWEVLKGGRKVEYHTTSKIMEEKALPESFELNANIVLIFNDKYEGYGPIINRGVCLDFDFSFEDKMVIFDDLMASGETSELDSEIVEYVRKSCSKATKNLSIRSLVILSRLKKVEEVKGDWKMFAEEVFKLDFKKDMLEKIIKKHTKLKDACEEWCGETGLGERTFYSRYREMKE